MLWGAAINTCSTHRPKVGSTPHNVSVGKQLVPPAGWHSCLSELLVTPPKAALTHNYKAKRVHKESVPSMLVTNSVNGNDKPSGHGSNT